LPCSSWLPGAGITSPFLDQQQTVLGGIVAGWFWLLGVLPLLSVLGVLTLMKLYRWLQGFGG
jgi:hypothetical protein